MAAVDHSDPQFSRRHVVRAFFVAHPRFRKRIGQLTAYALLVALSLFILMPVAWMITAALKPDLEPVFTVPTEWFPTTFWHWENFARVFNGTGLPFMRYTINSCIVVAGNILGTVISCSLVAFAFALGAGLAGAAGALLSPLSVMTPDMGLLAVLKAFAVVVVGGFGNIPGTIVAGFVMGIAESLGGGFISATYQDSIVFIILAVALMIRPTGLVRERLEENI